MTRTDSEHELVLGNKQLLSAFFVVVILLGVFFTMGYFVGKNTATASLNSGTSVASPGSRPDAAGRPLDSGSPSSSPPPESTSPAADPNTSAAAEDTVRTTPVAVEEPTRSRRAAESDEATPSPEKSRSEQMYLQVSALRRPDADNMVKVLRERGFPALLGESSKQGLFRVLVGPFRSNSELGHTKADLKSKGFESIVSK